MSMPDRIMAASTLAIAHARDRGDADVRPDDLLLGALETASRLGVVILGPLVIDLRELSPFPSEERSPRPPESRAAGRRGNDPVRPRYAPATAALFDRAAVLAREDGEAKVRLVHLLAAFGGAPGGLMARLMGRYDFDESGWRAALAAWDRETAPDTADGPPDRRVLSVDQAAETLGVHAQTVRGYIKTGKLPAYRIAGERSIRIYSSDLYDLLEPLEPSGDSDDEPARPDRPSLPATVGD
ncbi:MAG: helix-turn-helix domain-containing protein [Gemmatimonadota bacterium]|nr:helix-turn-helix domain-containing protein [Gemmatimonadota bacterium]